MLLFASDLDNTLIYSHRREIGTDKTPVELYEGRDVSFMTRRAQSMLSQVRGLAQFVPVSTRSAAQYGRIRFHPDWSPRLALVTNGGTLLVNGVSDPDWYAGSCDRIAPAQTALGEAETILADDPARMLDVHRVDGLFVYTKSQDPPATLQRLRQRLDPAVVDVFDNGSKIYALPRALDKGAAVQRLRERLPGLPVAAAGDSRFDLPLLRAAEFAFYPAALAYTPRDGQRAVCLQPEDGVFSDQLLVHVLALCGTQPSVPDA